MTFVQTPGGSLVQREITRTDEASPTYNYYGFADPGTGEDETGWSIMREHKTTYAIEWADGGRYSATWDNRTGETYS